MKPGPLCLVLGFLALAGCTTGDYRLGGVNEPDGPAGGEGAVGGVGGAGGAGGAGAGGGQGGVAGEAGVGGGSAGTNSAGTGGIDPGFGGSFGIGPGVGGGAGASTAGAGGTGGSSGGPLTDQVIQIVAEPGGVFRLEADERHVYFSPNRGQLWRVDHAGRDRTQLADGSLHHLLADETHLYFATEFELRRVAKAGGDVEVVAALSTQSVVAMALDESYVYASTYEGRTVVRAPKTGGQAQVLVRTSAVMGGVAVSGGALYWSEYASQESLVHRTDLESGATTVFFLGQALRLLAVGADLWLAPVTDDNNIIVRAPFAGGPVESYPFGSYTTFFKTDATHLYWTWDGVMRRNLSTGVEEKVADLLVLHPTQVALTRDWIFASDDAQPGGGLYRLPKPPP